MPACARSKSSLILSLLIVIVAVFGSSSAVALSDQSRSSEQLEFSAEDAGVKNPVAIPKDVLAILSKDEMVINVSTNEGVPPGKVPLSWFSTSEIHLSKSGEKDLVVEAEGPLAGANVAVFWVFFGTQHGHKLVMTAPAHDLIVRKSYWNGYRTIELVSESAENVSTVLCRYNGAKYVAYHTKTESLQ